MKPRFTLIKIIISLLIALTIYEISTRGIEIDASAQGSSGRQRLEKGSSCNYPPVDMVRMCQEAEEAILASTVRIEFAWEEPDRNSGADRSFRAISHGTIKDGRFIVTHNHFGNKLIRDLAGQKKDMRFSLYTASGQSIQTDISLLALSIFLEEAETLVLDLGQYAGDDTGQSEAKGYFELLGMSSGKFRDFPRAEFGQGSEVAQVLWDGVQTRVIWVLFKSIEIERGISFIELNSLLIEGSSGGGVFWNGYHIANNQSYTIRYNQVDGRLISYHSTAVLNSPEIIAQLENE